MKNTIMLTGLAALVGCGGHQTVNYDPEKHSLMNNPEYRKAHYECEMEAQKVGATHQAADQSITGLEGDLNAMHYGGEIYKTCMKAKGQW